MNDANADVIRHVTLDLGTGSRLHSYLERQIRVAESLIRFVYGPFDRFSNGFENSLRVFVQRLSLGRQDQLSARVLKEFYAELSLEHLDLERDGRRRQERALGGFFDGSMPRDQTQA